MKTHYQEALWIYKNSNPWICGICLQRIANLDEWICIIVQHKEENYFDIQWINLEKENFK